jgi:hypothetical protein
MKFFRKLFPIWLTLNTIIYGLVFFVREPIFGGIIMAPLLVINFPGALVNAVSQEMLFRVGIKFLGTGEYWRQQAAYAVIDIASCLLFWLVLLPLVNCMIKKINDFTCK